VNDLSVRTSKLIDRGSFLSKCEDKPKIYLCRQTGEAKV